MKIDENYFKVDDPLKHNKVEDIIDNDESILVRIKPNRAATIWEAILRGLPFTLLWLIIDSAVITGCVIGGKDDPNFPFWFLAPFFLLHLFPVWLYIGKLVKELASLKNVEYVFTDRRIIIRSGLIGIDFKSIFYTSITGVTCKVGLIERICKVGDIYITATDQTGIINNIPNPYFYLSKLQKITLDIKTDIYYPNELRPDENKGYKTKYKD